MKVWLYYRLSRDEDEELNSLNNQRKIIYNFAVSNGHQVVGESFDDNVSGMHFNREGIDKIYEVVEAGKIEAIIVKDLSRLGRHRTQTALFICDHTALWLSERSQHQYDRTPPGGVRNRADGLFSVFTGSWTERNRPQTQCTGAKDTSIAPGGTMRQRSLCGKQNQ